MKVLSKVLVVMLLVVAAAAVPEATFAAPDGGALIAKAQAWFGSIPVAIPSILLGLFGASWAGKIIASWMGNFDWVDRFDNAIKYSAYGTIGVFILPVGLTFLSQAIG